MLHDICGLMKAQVQSLPYFDVVAGLVKTQEEKITTETGGITIARYPVSVDVTGAQLQAGAIKDLVPDSYKRGILYFEGTKAVKTGRRFSFGEQWTAEVRLVGWYNLDNLNGDSYSDISNEVITKVMQAIGTVPVHTTKFKMVKPQFTGLTENQPGIFSNYTYDNAEFQLLMAPFAYFALDMAVTFVPAKGTCVADSFTNTFKTCY